MCHNMTMRTGKEVVCDNCGKQGARIRRVARTYGKGKDILVIENVPVVLCPHCGESYLEAETLHEVACPLSLASAIRHLYIAKFKSL